MGINHEWFDILHLVCRANGFRPGEAMLDVGASELFCSDHPESINDMLRHFGAPPYPPDELAVMADRAFAAPLFRRAGFRYAAIDYANFPGVVRLDLNTDALPAEHHGAYRFVANSGTSEHILNQYNVFKVIHDACAVDGIMYHGVPGWGDYEHGIIEYSPKFFWELATANDYEIVRYWGTMSGAPVPLKSEFLRQIRFERTPVADQVWLHTLLRKRREAPFRALNDPAFNAEATSPARN